MLVIPFDGGKCLFEQNWGRVQSFKNSHICRYRSTLTFSGSIQVRWFQEPNGHQNQPEIHKDPPKNEACCRYPMCEVIPEKTVVGD